MSLFLGSKIVEAIAEANSPVHTRSLAHQMDLDHDIARRLIIIEDTSSKSPVEKS
jgi:hypothetical protein